MRVNKTMQTSGDMNIHNMNVMTIIFYYDKSNFERRFLFVPYQQKYLSIIN